MNLQEKRNNLDDWYKDLLTYYFGLDVYPNFINISRISEYEFLTLGNTIKSNYLMDTTLQILENEQNSSASSMPSSSSTQSFLPQTNIREYSIEELYNREHPFLRMQSPQMMQTPQDHFDNFRRQMMAPQTDSEISPFDPNFPNFSRMMMGMPPGMPPGMMQAPQMQPPQRMQGMQAPQMMPQPMNSNHSEHPENIKEKTNKGKKKDISEQEFIINEVKYINDRLSAEEKATYFTELREIIEAQQNRSERGLIISMISTYHTLNTKMKEMQDKIKLMSRAIETNVDKNYKSLLDEFKDKIKQITITEKEEKVDECIKVGNELINVMDKLSLQICPVCLTNGIQVSLGCGHRFCHICSLRAIDSKKCFTCRKIIDRNDISYMFD